MKGKIFIPVLSVALLGAVVSCKKEVTSTPAEVTTTTEGSAYALDTLASKVEWKGYKIFKSENTSHFGTLKFESGDVTVKDGKLESGKFVANISSLENVDLASDAEQKSNLEGHLKSADFFEVEKFPTATYEITQVSEGKGDYNTVLDGNLTIKGITKPFRTNANVVIKDNVVTISTEPTDFNREEFGVSFKSPVENGVLKNEITLQVVVSAVMK